MPGCTWIVELEPGVWLAPWGGDPGRTLVKASAKQFTSLQQATAALAQARKERPFLDAEIQVVE